MLYTTIFTQIFQQTFLLINFFHTSSFLLQVTSTHMAVEQAGEILCLYKV